MANLDEAFGELGGSSHNVNNSYDNRSNDTDTQSIHNPIYNKINIDKYDNDKIDIIFNDYNNSPTPLEYNSKGCRSSSCNTKGMIATAHNKFKNSGPARRSQPFYKKFESSASNNVIENFQTISDDELQPKDEQESIFDKYYKQPANEYTDFLNDLVAYGAISLGLLLVLDLFVKVGKNI